MSHCTRELRDGHGGWEFCALSAGHDGPHRAADEIAPTALLTGSAPVERTPCLHDSMRGDGTLDRNCLRCGADGYWHQGHRHDRAHPSGKLLIALTCPDSTSEAGR